MSRDVKLLVGHSSSGPVWPSRRPGLRAGDDVMPGDETVWFIAHCWACELEVPFTEETERDTWVSIHGATAHDVVMSPFPEHVDPVTHLPLVSAREVVSQ